MKIIDTLTQSPEFHLPSKEPYVRMSTKSIERRDEINKMISSGKLQFEEVPCLCENESFDLISRFDKYGIMQKTVICRQCGLVQSNPRMTSKSTEWFYGSDFYGVLYGRIDGKSTTEFILSESKRRPQDRYKFVKANLDYSKIHTILEIGCSGGWNLYPYFNDGKKVVGYDYGPALVEAGTKLGMDLRVGKIENDMNEHGKYDLILMCHVYEHIPNPIKFIEDLKKYLAPGGYFYIEVPDMRELDMRGIINSHSYYYTKNTFLNYLEINDLSLKAYQKDKKKNGSQSGLFTVNNNGHNDTSCLKNEYQRIKKIILKDDRNLRIRKRLKEYSKKIKLFHLLSALSHIIRKHRKKPSRLETVFVTSE